MLNNKILFLFLTFAYTSFSFSKTISESEMYKMAESFYSQNLSFKDDRIIINTDKSFFKKSILYRGKNINKINTPAIVLLVSDRGDLSRIKTELSLDNFINQIKPFIKNEELVFKNHEDAILFLKKALNVFGIYSGKVNCNNVLEDKKYKCHLISSEPHFLDTFILVSNAGEMEVQ